MEIFAIILAISVGIGGFYSHRGRKTEPPLPVAGSPLYRPMIWLGEDQDAHVQDFKRIGIIEPSAPDMLTERVEAVRQLDEALRRGYALEARNISANDVGQNSYFSLGTSSLDFTQPIAPSMRIGLAYPGSATYKEGNIIWIANDET